MKAPSLEDVLGSFSVEPEHDKATLERYLLRYPEFAVDLVDLSRQLMRPVKVDRSPLSHRERDRVNAAWSAHVAVRPVAGDPLAALDVSKSRELAKAFDLPRQVITAFHERRVAVASVPRRFLLQLAMRLDTTAEALAAALSELVAQPTHSYKSDEKPAIPQQVTFEQVLVDANVPADRRAVLLAEGE